jgi:uncharacterized membrane protein YphA (DoxX/SURF4 family)
MANPERLVRLSAGIVFVLAGIAKFAFNGPEVDAFERYGLPLPELFVLAVGALELGGGAMLIADRGVRLVAPLLAATMVGAIVVSGIGEGEVVPSLTLAPLLLAASAWLSLRRPAPG